MGGGGGGGGREEKKGEEGGTHDKKTSPFFHLSAFSMKRGGWEKRGEEKKRS